jgi:hypothetical protein
VLSVVEVVADHILMKYKYSCALEFVAAAIAIEAAAAAARAPTAETLLLIHIN